jgi:transcriptional regulator with XRE-family HTH domain
MAARKMTRTTKADYVPARVRVVLTPGDALRIAREAQEMSQAQLATACGIAQGTISSLEQGRAALGAARAEKLARALRVHPAVLLWPNGWDLDAPARSA